MNKGEYQFTCKKCGILFLSHVSGLSHEEGRSGGYDNVLWQHCPRCGWKNVIAESFPTNPIYTAYLDYLYPNRTW